MQSSAEHRDKARDEKNLLPTDLIENIQQAIRF